MLFGLFHALASFQGFINKILVEKLNIFLIVHLDTILISPKDYGELHVDTVYWVLEQFRRHSLFANLKKCRFHQDEIRFLRFMILSYSITIKKERMEAVKARLEPKSIKDIEMLLRFANSYRCFIQGFSKIAVSLTLMLKTMAGTSPRIADNSSLVTYEAKLAFLRLRQAFRKALITHYCDPERYIWIEKDAFDYVISGILSQLIAETT